MSNNANTLKDQISVRTRTRICENCGKTFTVDGERIKKYCSRSCTRHAYYCAKRDGKSKNIYTNICNVCGKEFQTKTALKLSCSPECQAKHKNSNDRTRLLEYKEKQPEKYEYKYICRYCNNIFTTTDKRDRFYCSEQCRKAVNRERKRDYDKKTKKNITLIIVIVTAINQKIKAKINFTFFKQ
jgi:predicted nucleic acid-binding Zn ribbon protein